MNSRPATPPYLLATAAGMSLWFAASYISGSREPWDARIYWNAAYPLAIFLSGMLGFYFPVRPWRWAVALFLSQFLAMTIRNGEIGNLWPLGLMLFALLSIPGIVVGSLAARLRGSPGRRL